MKRFIVYEDQLENGTVEDPNIRGLKDDQFKNK